MKSTGFPSPFDVEAPHGCEGWEELYPPYMLFAAERRSFDEERFWFQDAVHYPEPHYPFDAAILELTVVGLNQANARLFVLPSSLGTECRLLNGYVYLSPNSVTDEAAVTRRSELFEARARFYYDGWEDLDARWCEKVEREIRQLEALQVADLPDVEDLTLVTRGQGWGSAHALVAAYDQLLESVDRIAHYHFELVNLGYGAYLTFYEVCRRVFPDISDQTIARMVAGIDVVALRPDDELRRLAALAVKQGVAEAVISAWDEEELHALLEGSEAGDRWLTAFEKAKSPWFNFSYGNGLYHHHRSWIDDTRLPISMIGSYAERFLAGDDVARPREAVIAQRDRITAEHRALLTGSELSVFDDHLALARTVFPHIENHNFYLDHWYHTVFWNKVRDFGALLARHRFLGDAEDVFYLRPDEVRSALHELRLVWSSGASPALGAMHWPRTVEKRRAIYEALREWTPPPALGRAPEQITEPLTIMHWGFTTERVEEWLAAAGAAADTLHGIAGSPGVVEGRARVVHGVDQLGELEDGEILVAPFTSTSWTPVFGRIAAAVTDAGGVMCHAAIVAREYGLPAVLGTGSATQQIATGDLIRVDADRGVVEILRRA
jgi:phosphohistidine swiveling domain-containing protein